MVLTMMHSFDHRLNVQVLRIDLSYMFYFIQVLPAKKRQEDEFLLSNLLVSLIKCTFYNYSFR